MWDLYIATWYLILDNEKRMINCTAILLIYWRLARNQG